MSILLDPKQERFAQSMALHGNQSLAVRECDVALTTGRRWLEDLDVQLRIEEIKQEIRDGIQFTRDDVIQNLVRIVRADPRRLFNGANLKSINTLDDDTAAAIDVIEIEEGLTKDGEAASGLKIKTISKRDKLKALQELGKHFNIYADHEKSGAGQMIVNIHGKDAQL